MAHSSSAETERIRAQVGISIGLARSLVSTWLPPDDKEVSAKEKNAQGQKDELPQRRGQKAGLGATEDIETKALTLAEHKLERKVMQKRKRLESAAREETQRKASGSDSEENEAKKGSSRKVVKMSNPPKLKHTRKGFGRGPS